MEIKIEAVSNGKDYGYEISAKPDGFYRTVILKQDWCGCDCNEVEFDIDELILALETIKGIHRIEKDIDESAEVYKKLKSKQ